MLDNAIMVITQAEVIQHTLFFAKTFVAFGKMKEASLHMLGLNMKDDKNVNTNCAPQ